MLMIRIENWSIHVATPVKGLDELKDNILMISTITVLLIKEFTAF
jgi:superfamily II DNA/RNA helicase